MGRRPNLSRETKFSNADGDDTERNFSCSADHEQDYCVATMPIDAQPPICDDYIIYIYIYIVWLYSAESAYYLIIMLLIQKVAEYTNNY